MEWGHEKNDKQQTHICRVLRKVLCVLSSSVRCIRPTPGVVSLLSIDYRFQRLKSPSIGVHLGARTPQNIIS